jgi:hypothetical protein
MTPHNGHDDDLEFERRLDDWRSGGPELTEAEAQRYLAQMDPDFGAVEDYLHDEMSPADQAAFDLRLVTDPAFRKKMQPSLDIHRAIGMMMLGSSRPITPVTRVKAAQSQWRRLFNVERVLIFGGFFAAASLVFRLYAVESAHWQGNTDRLLGLAWTGDMTHATTVTNGPDETTTLPLPQATVTLRPSSHFTVEHEGYTMRAALDGDALFAIVADTVSVRTALADIRTTRGYIEVTSPPGAGETLVRVYYGYADVAPVGTLLGTRIGALHSIRLSRDHATVVDSIKAETIPAMNLFTRMRGYKK